MHFLRLHTVGSHRFLELFVYAFFGVLVSVGIFLLIHLLRGEPILPATMIDQGNALPVSTTGLVP